MLVTKMLCLLLSALCANYCISSKDVVLDEILAVLPHRDGDILILASDLEMSIDGSTRTLWDVIIDGLMVLKARDIGIAVSESALEGMIGTIQKRNHMTQEQFIELFEAQGYSFEEGRELLKRRKMIDDLLGAMIRVDDPTKDELERYYAAHPVYEEARYTVRLAFVPSAEFSDEMVQEMIAKRTVPDTIQWDDAEEYAESALSEEQRFVQAMEVGEIRSMGVTDGGHDIVQLVDKQEMKLLPLDEMHVGMAVRQHKFLEALHTFQDELLAKAHVRFCDPSLSLETIKRPVDDTMHASHAHSQQEAQ